METSTWSIATSAMSIVVVWLDFLKSAIASMAWPITVMVSVLLFRKDFVSLLAALVSIKAGGVEAFFNRTLQNMPPLPDETQGASEPEDDGAGATTPSPKLDLDPTSKQDEVAQTKPAEDPTSADNFQDDTHSKWDVAHIFPKKGPRRKAIFQISPRTVRILEVRSLLEQSLTVAEQAPTAAVIIAWSAVEVMVREASKALLSAPPKNARIAMQQLYFNDHVSALVFDRFRQLQDLRNEVAHTNHFNASFASVMDYLARVNEVVAALQSALDAGNTATQPAPTPPDAHEPSENPTQQG
jgi:hypothetical protein